MMMMIMMDHFIYTFRRFVGNVEVEAEHKSHPPSSRLRIIFWIQPSEESFAPEKSDQLFESFAFVRSRSTMEQIVPNTSHRIYTPN